MSKISLKHSGGNVVSLNSPTSAPTSADVAFKLPNADGSADTFLKTNGSGDLSFSALPASGITMADRWHLTGNFNLSSGSTFYTITGTWAKGTSAGYNTGSIGSAMTESSGVFTFPSTGIYYIIYNCLTGTSNDQLNMWSYITVGSDATSNNYLSVMASSGDSGTMNTVTHSAMLDVTDVSAQKVFIRAYAANSGCYVSGNTDLNRTNLNFIRLGDT